MRQAEILAVWTGGAFGQPLVVAIETVFNIPLVQSHLKFRSEFGGFVPSSNFHEEELNISAEVKVSKQCMARLVEQSKPASIVFELVGDVVDDIEACIIGKSITWQVIKLRIMRNYVQTHPRLLFTSIGELRSDW